MTLVWLAIPDPYLFLLQRGPAARQIPQFLDGTRRYEAALQRAALHEINNPFAILHISLLARQGPHLRRGCCRSSKPASVGECWFMREWFSGREYVAATGVRQPSGSLPLRSWTALLQSGLPSRSQVPPAPLPIDAIK
jgi:hypothetical protein